MVSTLEIPHATKRSIRRMSTSFTSLNNDPESFVPPYFGITMLGNSHGFDPKGTTTGFVVWINSLTRKVVFWLTILSRRFQARNPLLQLLFGCLGLRLFRVLAVSAPLVVGVVFSLS